MTSPPAQGAYSDQPMPTTIRIDPINPRYLKRVNQLMKEHGGGINAEEAVFPDGTIKRFNWPRIIHTRYTVLFPDGWQIGLTETRDGKNMLSFDPDEMICPECHRSL